MSIELKHETPTYDLDWGCSYLKVGTNPHIEAVKLCLVNISDILKIASELTKKVQDSSWMMSLDKGTKRSYEKTVEATANKLVEIFNHTSVSGSLGGEFGELMVSIGSARALEVLFAHHVLPIAELWKPQLKQNEGFDFHTVCSSEMINFGEAKFSSTDSPHGNAISQAHRFICEEKHFRDRVHLINLTSPNAIQNLDNDDFGIVAAFSIHAVNPLTVLNNALESVRKTFPSSNAKYVYLVGVIH
ncbi:hypothetical protein [Sulfurospirillum oryzae]|uniref:hypothetical protein n=1 Tax=Sulfurospirillum oryzae TaxID=2976535 RepID=UPI0021E8D442|nr:hypothetical protein [Sulfurospirillum oryzae]